MADNLCGPSTALKSFGDHVNRDRSLHQDRAGAGQAGPSSNNFRSASSVSPNAEAEYQAFMNNGLASLSLMPVGPENPAFMDPGAPVHQQQQHQHQHQQHHPHALHGPRHPGLQGHQNFQGLHGHHNLAMTAHAVGAGASSTAQQHNQWAAEFASASSASMSTTAHAHTLAPLPGHVHSPQSLQAVNRLQHFSMGVASGPVYTPAGFAHAAMPVFSAPAVPAATAAPAAPAATAASAPSGVGGLTEAQLEAQFAAAQAEMDFEDEMNAWMATHGPTAEEAAAAQEQQISEELEHIADELEAQRVAGEEGVTGEEDVAAVESESVAAEPDPEAVAAAEQAREEEELARIAGSIVATLSANPNSRFQESSFMRLMHRMEAREVTVRGDSLVDGATGQPIEVIVQDEKEQQQKEQEQPQQPQQQQQMPGV